MNVFNDSSLVTRSSRPLVERFPLLLFRLSETFRCTGTMKTATEEPPQETVDEVALPGITVRSFPDSRPAMLLKASEQGLEKMYEPVFPAGLSLESCEGDVKAASIEFVHDTAMYVEHIENLKSSGDSLQTLPMPLYHAHVLWSYILRISRVKGKKCALSLLSIGPHLGMDSTPKKGSLGRNEPAGLNMPRVLGASITVLRGEEKEEGLKMDLSPDRGGALSAATQFSKAELLDLASGGVLRMRLRIIVGRSYFDLRKLIDLKAPTATVSGAAEGILDLIIRGERPPDYDWAITVGESDVPGPSLFYVHKAAFGSMSDVFRVAFQTEHSYEDQILMVTGESRCIVTSLTAEDMKVVIPLVYGLYAPLPERWQRISVLGRNLCRLFKADLITGVVFPHWERTICQQALAIDKTDVASLPTIFRLLILIWSCPYGSMPVAKRVAVGVMADMLHLNTDPTAEAPRSKLLVETVLPSLGDLGQTAHVVSIMGSVMAHLYMISAVRKTGLAAREAEWK